MAPAQLSWLLEHRWADSRSVAQQDVTDMRTTYLADLLTDL